MKTRHPKHSLHDDTQHEEYISNCIQTYIKRFNHNSNYTLDAFSDNENDIELFKHFLHVQILNETSLDNRQCFIKYANDKELMSEDIITAGLWDFEPKAGVVICGCQTGVLFSHNSKVFSKLDEKSKQMNLENYKHSFTKRVTKEETELNTVFLPVFLDHLSQWGFFVCVRELKGENEKRFVWWGDGLGIKGTPPMVTFFVACLNAAFGKSCLYKIEKANYATDVLKYEAQKDGYSCGAYVMAAASSFALSSGFMPVKSYTSGYSASLTELYRWGALRVLTWYTLKHLQSNSDANEVDVHRFMSEIRLLHREWINMTLEVEEKPVMLRDESTDNKNENDVEEKETRNVQLQAEHSSSTAEDNQDSDYEIENADEMDRMEQERNVAEKCIVPESITNLVGTTARPPKRVQSLFHYINNLSTDGYRFSFHKSRVMQYRKNYFYSVRLRCYRFKKSLGSCRFAITAKLRGDLSGWNIVQGDDVQHSHKAKKLDEMEKKNTAESKALSSITLKVCDDLRRVPKKISIQYRESLDQVFGEARQVYGNYQRLQNQNCSVEADTSTANAGAPIAVETETFEDSKDGEGLVQFEENVVKENGEEKVNFEVDGVSSEDMEDIVESESTPLFVSQSQSLKWALAAYLSSVQMNQSGSRVLKTICSIGESLGFQLYIRHSVYRSDAFVAQDVPPTTFLSRSDFPSSSATKERVLKRAKIRCKAVHDETLRCPFLVTVFTVEMRESKAEMTAYSYRLDDSLADHNHENDACLFRSRLPAEMMDEAYYMKETLRMRLKDVARILHLRFNIKIRKDKIRKKLDYTRSLRDPKDGECLRLCQSLLEIKKEDNRNQVFIRTVDEGHLQHVAWAFTEWLEDYERFGIIPGISIDCKAIANSYGMPLVTINGRDNYGHVFTVFMGFLSNETEESFLWLFRCVKKCIRLPPTIISMDQCVSCIVAAKKEFPNSTIHIDDWHLNKNQKSNCAAWCSSIKRTDFIQPMESSLFLLRKSSTIQLFQTRRAEFEQKFINPYISMQRKKPRWFTYLYHEVPSYLVHAYKNIDVPHRFLFQGTGYTESSNSIYKRYILDENVRIYLIPFEIRRLSIERRQELKKVEDGKTNIIHKQLLKCMLSLPTTVSEFISSTYTPYMLRCIINIVHSKSSRFVLNETAVISFTEINFENLILSETVKNNVDQAKDVVRFKLFYEPLETNELQSNSTPYYVFVLQKKPDISNILESVKHIMCTCNHLVIHGFCCPHVLRVAVVYKEQLLQNPNVQNLVGSRFPIEDCIHPYWLRTGSFLTPSSIAEMRTDAFMTSNIESDQLSLNITNSNDVPTDLESQIEVFLKYSDAKAIFDQAHRLASAKGRGVALQLQNVLKFVVQQISQNGMIPISFHVPLESNGMAINQKTGFSSDVNTDQNIDSSEKLNVKNPNFGNVRNGKRKKSWSETGIKSSRSRNNKRNPKVMDNKDGSDNVRDLNTFIQNAVDMVDSHFHGI